MKPKVWCAVALSLLCLTHTLTAAPPPSGDLASRFERLSCAVVLIKSGNHYGTGFFVTPQGRLVTAAHLVLSVSYSAENRQIRVTVTARPNLQLIIGENQSIPLTISLTPTDSERATADLALIETGLKTPCHLRLGASDNLKIGHHLIAIGQPTSARALALYEGFLSSRYRHLPIPVGHIGTEPVYPIYEVLRIQMPITPGTSGSPVIADDDTVVGVISEVPVIWVQELSDLIQVMMRRGGSGVLLSGFDTTKLLAQLAWIVQEFESPGAGIAVPISYLKPPTKRPDQPPGR